MPRARRGPGRTAGRASPSGPGSVAPPRRAVAEARSRESPSVRASPAPGSDGSDVPPRGPPGARPRARPWGSPGPVAAPLPSSRRARPAWRPRHGGIEGSGRCPTSGGGSSSGPAAAPRSPGRSAGRTGDLGRARSASHRARTRPPRLRAAGLAAPRRRLPGGAETPLRGRPRVAPGREPGDPHRGVDVPSPGSPSTPRSPRGGTPCCSGSPRARRDPVVGSAREPRHRGPPGTGRTTSSGGGAPVPACSCARG